MSDGEPTLCKSAKQTDCETAGFLSGESGRICSLIPQKSFIRPSTTIGFPSDKVVRNVSSMLSPSPDAGGAVGATGAAGGGAGAEVGAGLFDNSST